MTLRERLTELLINNKLITQDQLNQALLVQQKKGGRLSDILIELKFIKEKDLALSLSEGLGLPLIDLKRLNIDHETLKLVPAAISRHYQIIPVSRMGKVMTVAMADPLNIFAIDHLKTLTGYKINTIIATSKDILDVIASSYPDTSSVSVEDLVKEISDTSIEFIKEEKEIFPSDQELSRISQEAPVIKVTNLILADAVAKKASDILIEPFEKKIRLRYRIDGVLQEHKAPARKMHASIVSRIKVMSDLNIAEHRLPQDSRFKAKISNKEIDFRVSVMPSSFGEKVALRILDKTQVTLDIDKLGFSQDALEKLKKVALLPHGMLLVCGPTGSGKTTTLYSILKFIDTPEKNIVTVEDPVEYQLEGINQVTVKQEIGLIFASALRSILRQDPNIIMIGEIRDFETVDIAIKSALTGHLVISTLHTTTASGSIVRLINMGVEPYLINSSVGCVVSQRLLRRICHHCKEKQDIKKEIIDNLGLNLTGEKKVEFFHGKGCSRCFNTGYSGRVAIAEVLLLSTKIRDLILSHAQEHLIKQQARKEGMKTLREEGLAAALSGVTTLEEVIRVTASDEKE